MIYNVPFSRPTHDPIFVIHSNDSCIASYSQYRGDNCRTSCSDTGSVNCPVAGCRCSSSQNIANAELRSPVSNTGGQCELLGGSTDIFHWEIETQRKSSFRGSIPMEASTSGSEEIKLIIAVVAAAVQKPQQISSSSNMSRSNFIMIAYIPPGVRWGDLVL